jgi:NADPH:quinone reductase-like Zn-dependent oxidoreductase
MTKIVRFREIGGPEVLKIEDVPSRQASKGEACLRVQAIGLNRAKSMFMHGYGKPVNTERGMFWGRARPLAAPVQ